MNKNILRRTLIVLVPVFLVACGKPRSEHRGAGGSPQLRGTDEMSAPNVDFGLGAMSSECRQGYDLARQKTYQDGVLYIQSIIQPGDTKEIGRGTIFRIDKNLFLTARHVISEESLGGFVAKKNLQFTVFNSKSSAINANPDSNDLKETLEFNVLDFDQSNNSKKDFAVLEVSLDKNDPQKVKQFLQRVPILKMGTEEEIKSIPVGEKLIGIGFPSQCRTSYSYRVAYTGQKIQKLDSPQSSFMTDLAVWLNGLGLLMVQLDGGVLSSGSSGGPLLFTVNGEDKVAAITSVEALVHNVNIKLAGTIPLIGDIRERIDHHAKWQRIPPDWR